MSTPLDRPARILGALLAVVASAGLSACGTSATPEDGAAPGSATAADPVDMHAVNLGFVTVPGALCGNPDDVELRDGMATGVGEWPLYDPPEPLDLIATPEETVFDDLDGDGRDEAFLPAYCTIHDGTASSRTATAVYVFSGETGTPTLLGTITADPDLGEGNATLMTVRSVDSGEVAVDEFFYSLDDMTCCPTGQAISTWVWDGAELTSAGSEVQQQPARQTTLDACGTMWCYATTPQQTLDLVLTAQDIGEHAALAQLAPGVDLDALRRAHDAGVPGVAECDPYGAGDRFECSVELGDEPWSFIAAQVDHSVIGQAMPLWVLTSIDPA